MWKHARILHGFSSHGRGRSSGLSSPSGPRWKWQSKEGHEIFQGSMRLGSRVGRKRAVSIKA